MKKMIALTGYLLLSLVGHTQTRDISISTDSSYLHLYQSGKIPLPAWVLSCNKIREVDLSNQPDLYNAIEQLSGMDSIKKIIIQNAGIRNLPYNIFKLKNLRHIDARSNRLKTLPYSIRYCLALESIDLDNNEMSNYGLIDIFKHVSKLDWFSINGNQLDSLPTEICLADKLMILSISDNKIRELPECIYFMKSLRQFIVKGKRMDGPPPKSLLSVPEVKEKFQKNGLRLLVE